MRKTYEEHKLYCDNGEPPVPSSAHYNTHKYYKNEFPFCPKSRIENAMTEYLRKYGTLEGYKYRGPKLSLDEHLKYCTDGRPPLPSGTHYYVHFSNNIPFCEKSRIEAAMYRQLRINGTLEGYEYTKRGKGIYDCDSQEELQISNAHYKHHIDKGTEPCDRSREEKSLYHWHLEHPDAKKYDPRGEFVPHSVYKYTFESDGAVYYGITSSTIQARLRSGYNFEMKERINSGEFFLASVVAKFASKTEALHFERMLIKSHRGSPLLNIIHNKKRKNKT